jgi:glycine/D-amino acid oxidase-like deaminating enzyme
MLFPTAAGHAARAKSSGDMASESFNFARDLPARSIRSEIILASDRLASCGGAEGFQLCSLGIATGIERKWRTLQYTSILAHQSREPIVIAGAGIIGAALAYHLAKRGAQVTILEAQQLAAGATGKSFGWINATFSKRPRSYFDFSMLGIAGWHRLEKELNGALRVQWGGSVAWFPPGPEAEQLRQDVQHHREWGYPVRLLDEAQVRELLPHVSPGPIRAACHSEPEGAVDPIVAVNVLLDKAREYGAELQVMCEVTGFDFATDRVLAVHTSQGSIPAGTVVLACGVNSPYLARIAGVNVPLKDAPGILLHLTPQRPLINRIVQAPGLHFRQELDGRIVVGGQVVAGAGTAETPIVEEQDIFEKFNEFLDFKGGIERTTMGYRVMPADEYPIVGFADPCPNLYVTATHSGVTLAPVIGELATVEILDGIAQQQFAPYRLSRFV